MVFEYPCFGHHKYVPIPTHILSFLCSMQGKSKKKGKKSPFGPILFVISLITTMYGTHIEM